MLSKRQATIRQETEVLKKIGKRGVRKPSLVDFIFVSKGYPGIRAIRLQSQPSLLGCQVIPSSLSLGETRS